jgi:hypothetical protein
MLHETLMVQQLKQLTGQSTSPALEPLGAAQFQKRTTQPIWSNQNVSSREKVSSQ